MTDEDENEAAVIPIAYADTDTKNAANILVEALEALKQGGVVAVALGIAFSDGAMFLDWFGDEAALDFIEGRLQRDRMMAELDD